MNLTYCFNRIIILKSRLILIVFLCVQIFIFFKHIIQKNLGKPVSIHAASFMLGYFFSWALQSKQYGLFILLKFLQYEVKKESISN